MVFASNICINGPELGEGVAAQLESAIYEPGLGFAEELKLLFGATKIKKLSKQII